MKTVLYYILPFFVFIAISQFATAQQPTKPKVTVAKKDLPKLDQVVIGNSKSILVSPDAKDMGPHISDTEAQNRSTSDGKISKKELDLIERARKMPQAY